VTTLDLSNVMSGLDAYVAAQEAQIRTGLRAAAEEAQRDMQATTAHGDVTGATRAGYVAYVVGGSLVDEAVAAQALGSAVAAVERLNPGQSATAEATIGTESWGVVLTCPTAYQPDLETENAGLRAVLAPTFAAVVNELTERAARGR
jgi:hypothetical protein